MRVAAWVSSQQISEEKQVGGNTHVDSDTAARWAAVGVGHGAGDSGRAAGGRRVGDHGLGDGGGGGGD